MISNVDKYVLAGGISIKYDIKFYSLPKIFSVKIQAKQDFYKHI